MKYVLNRPTPAFPQGYVYDTEDENAPKSLIKAFIEHPEWFTAVRN